VYKTRPKKLAGGVVAPDPQKYFALFRGHNFLFAYSSRNTTDITYVNIGVTLLMIK
jgi:hypothetical protein